MPNATLRTIAALLPLLFGDAANTTTIQLPGPDGTPAKLDALVTRPNKPGRFPLALINHGLPRDATARVRQAPEAYSGPSIVFAQHGYVAVVVNRRGFGQSSGPIETATGPCSDKHYSTVARDWSADILAAMTSLRQEPWVDPDRILLVGHSAGGLTALAAAAQNPPGLVGIVDFAGEVGSSMPDFVCQPERLVQTMRELGATVRTPGLWIFGANDHFFGPALAQQVFAAYTAGGAPAEFDAAPAFSTDGHSLVFAAAPAPWWPRVAGFLQQLNLPTSLVVNLPPPDDLPVPSGLDARGTADFAAYVTSRSYEKAFVIDQYGHYGRALGQRTKEDAEAAALTHCKQRQWTCSIYAIDNTLVAGDSAKP